jgi:sulfoxide reductase heme-binding subunit YedZ
VIVVARDSLSLRVQKSVLLLVCLIPAASLVWRAFGVAGTSLGANPVEALLHGFGKWGLNFLLLTLTVTPVRQLLRWPHVLHFRRLLGLTAFFYLGMHFLIWFGLDQQFYLAGIGEDIVRRPFITIGFIALLMLVPLAVTSTDRMMRRLGRRWTKLHRLIYPVAILGVWHYYWQVKLDVREPLIYGAVLASLLGWRAWHAGRRRRARQQTGESVRPGRQSEATG